MRITCISVTNLHCQFLIPAIIRIGQKCRNCKQTYPRLADTFLDGEAHVEVKFVNDQIGSGQYIVSPRTPKKAGKGVKGFGSGQETALCEGHGVDV
jgi:hypothetical protein